MLVGAALCILRPHLLSAQQVASTLRSVAPSGLSITDYAERTFDRASGLGSSTVYDLTLDAEGTPWIATEDGLYQYTGSRWRRDSLPGLGAQQWVRAVLFASDRSLWVATRVGIIRRRPDGVIERFDEPHGVTGTLAYSLIETRAIDGQRRVVAGLYGGVAYYNGSQFVPLPNAGIPSPRGVVVAEAQGRDGAPELWMADAASVAARFREGRWDTFGPAEGLDVGKAEHIIGSDGRGSASVLVAGERGVYALDRSGPVDRFVRVPGAPERATRVAVVRGADGGSELWVGTQGGTLRRLRDGRWQDIAIRVTDRRGAFLLLRFIPGHGQGPIVYASTRTGSLVRLAFGSSATLSLNAGQISAVFAEGDRNGRDALWWTGSERTITRLGGDGVQQRFRVPPELGERRVYPASLDRYDVSSPRPAESVAAIADTGVLVAVLGGEPWQLRGGKVLAMRQGLRRTRVQQLLRTTALDGVDRLLAATPSGLYSWTGVQWKRMPLVGTGVRTAMQIRAMAVDEQSARHRLLLGTNRGIVVVDGEDPRLEVPSIGEARDSLIRVERLCVSRWRNAPARYFALVSNEGVFSRLATDSAWQRLPAHVARTTPVATAVDMRCTQSGQLAIAVPNSVVFMDVRAADPAAWQVVAQLSEADGLPPSPIAQLAESGVPWALWVGTAGDLGLVDVRQTSARRRIPLRVQLSSQQTGAGFADGAVLRPGDDDVQVDAALLTFHREEGTRFRVRLRATGWRSTLGIDASTNDPEREWLPSPTRNFLDLAPGAYELTVWAYDWTGAEHGPVVQRFTISAPVWRRWPALVLYVALLTFLGILAYRWRRRTLADAEQERADAERQVAAERAFFEEQIREAQKLESLGTLAGGVAHDFNNLLGVIRGNAELARTALRKGRGNDDHLGAILDASDRARDIVRQILTFSRRSTPTRDFVNLAMLVRDLQPLLRRMVPRSVRLVFEGLDGVYVIRGDSTQLQQLLLNLVSNAEHAVRDRDEQIVTITVGGRLIADQAMVPYGEVVVLRVSDTGAGMSAEVRQRLFEPFFTTKPTGEGTGLGMAVVHGIVVSHGARADVVSAEGQGTTFEILFPRVTMDALFDEGLDPSMTDSGERRESSSDAESTPSGGTLVVAGAAPDPVRSRVVSVDGAVESAVDGDVDGAIDGDDRDGPGRGGASIMVVDDEPAVGRVVAQALAQGGHTVQLFTRPEEALAALRHAPGAVDLLITDQTMPGMTGDVLAESVHQLRSDLPVVVLTGFRFRLSAERIAAAGIHRVLDKPVELAVLAEVVEEALVRMGEGGPVPGRL